MSIRVFEVGGCIRDEMLGIESKDVDFAVEGIDSMDELAAFVESEGHKVVHRHEDKWTVVASVAKDHPLRGRTNSADFVRCRIDGPSTDGRNPDFVETGTIFDDLARRDFTVNAMARSVDTGKLLDPHGGRDDLANMILRFVGDPATRITEDGTRVPRALRFCVTKGFRMDPDTFAAINSDHAADQLLRRPVDSWIKEVQKMLQHDSVESMKLLLSVPALHRAIFRDGLHLDASLKKV